MDSPIGAPWRNLDEFDALIIGAIYSRSQNCLEVCGKERIGVVNEMCGVAQEAVDGLGQVACDLFHPGAVWIDANARDVDFASFKFDDEEHHVPHGPKDAKCLGGEEIACVQGLPMGVHQLLPSTLLLSLWGGDDACFIEDIGNGTAADVDAKSKIDGISDLCVSPAEIVFGYGQHEPARLFRLARTPWLSARLRAVVLLRIDVAKPGENYPWPNDLTALLALFGRELLASDGEAPPLAVCEIDAALAGHSLEDLLENENFLCLVVEPRLHSLID